MRPKRFLLVPGNNSLSHVAKCLAIRKALAERGHESLITVSRKNAAFLSRMGVEHAVLPDIQENDDAGLPTVEWFRDPTHISGCVEAEIDLIKRWRPDRVLGVFRFTLKASAQAAGVPYDSLVSGCLMPDCGETLGFSNGEAGSASQRIVLDGFFQYAGARASRAFERFGVAPVGNIFMLLRGERTFLWDFPEFVPRQPSDDVIHVGPITWDGWPCDDIDLDRVRGNGSPLAVIAFGTCASSTAVAVRLVSILDRLGYRVIVAAGGREEVMRRIASNGRITVCSFAPLQDIFPRADLLISHGGQMTLFEALQHEVPTMVMPFQPEQAHNGVCLERLGCGKRLIPSRCFQGNPSVYIDAFNLQSDDEIASTIAKLVRNPALPERLAAVRNMLRKYRGAAALADHFGEA